MSKTKVPWTKGPWILRESVHGLPPFVEAPKAKGMAYGLDVCGDDYGGYGEDEQREINMRLIALSPEMADAILSGDSAAISSMAERLLKICRDFGK